LKYHLGCGSVYLEGYVNVDFPQEHHNINHSIKADLYVDIMKMKYEKCDEIKSNHFFEHFSYVDSLVLLYKWTKALNFEGILDIGIPDVEELCKAFVIGNTATKFKVIRYLYGSHEADWAYHLNGWSKDTLTHVLEILGYKIEDISSHGDFNSDFPNCGLNIKARLTVLFYLEDLQEKIKEILLMYKNGNTEFEKNLYDYNCECFVRKIEQLS
jgi:predicted SAM-dependent methyltransferase